MKAIVIMLLAVLFVPLFCIEDASAETYITAGTYPASPYSIEEYPNQVILERTFNSTQTTTIYVSKSQFYYYTYNSAYYIYRVTAETIYSSNLSADGLSWVSEGSSGSPKNIGNATEPKVRIKYSTTDILTGTQTAPGTGVYFAANIGLGVRTEDLPQIPSSDMQYYIVYEDIENNDYYKYEFETVPVFDVGTCYDADEKIYDINFYGNGKYKIYKLDSILSMRLLL
jgi:hypothetical protein